LHKLKRIALPEQILKEKKEICGRYLHLVVGSNPTHTPRLMSWKSRKIITWKSVSANQLLKENNKLATLILLKKELQLRLILNIFKQ
jgi:hypothetical protein